MLKITTSNGDTLIHADQQPDLYNGRSADGSTYMVHGGAWGNHKYIRKEGNKYIYPEDMSNKGRTRGSNNLENSENVLPKQYRFRKDLTPEEFEKGKARVKSSFRDDPYYFAKGENVALKRRQEIKENIKKRQEEADKGLISKKAAKQSESERKNKYDELKKEKDAKLKERKDRSKKIEDQRKSAHAGYEAERKKFAGDLTSTEELEIQKDRTKARKTLKRTKDTLERMRKKNNRRNSK